jgi:hypothetical protein
MLWSSLVGARVVETRFGGGSVLSPKVSWDEMGGWWCFEL